MCVRSFGVCDMTSSGGVTGVGLGVVGVELIGMGTTNACGEEISVWGRGM